MIVVYICTRRFSDGFIWLTKLDAIQQCRFSAKSSYEQKWLATFFAGDSGGFWQQALFWSLFCLFLTHMIVTQEQLARNFHICYESLGMGAFQFRDRSPSMKRPCVGGFFDGLVCLFVCLFFVTQSA